MIEIKIVYVILTAVLFALTLLYAVCATRLLKRVRYRLQGISAILYQLKNYMYMFSRHDIENNGMKDWMNITAHYIADIIKAEGVGIYLSEVTYMNEGGAIKDIDEIHVSGRARYALAGMNSRFPLELVKEKTCNWNDPKELQELSEKKDSLLSLAFASMLKKEPLLINRDDPGYGHFLKDLRLTSFLCLPLEQTGENMVGMLIAINTDRMKQNSLTLESVAYLFKFVPMIIMAYNLLNMYGMFRLQWKIRQELEFTRDLQLSMLPKEIPSWGVFSIDAKSKPAKRVGGDFYDFIVIDKHRALVVIGDASGNGIPACLYMAMTRSYIRANLPHFTTLKALLYEVNDNLRRDTSTDHYVTLALCLLDKSENTVEYICAGHTNLLIYVRNHTRIVHPEGSVIGLMPSEFLSFDPFTIRFDEDMAFFMYTDGINEAESATGERFGDARIEASFKSSMCRTFPGADGKLHRVISPATLIDKLLTDVDGFTASTDPADHDDRTLVMISCKK